MKPLISDLASKESWASMSEERFVPLALGGGILRLGQWGRFFFSEDNGACTTGTSHSSSDHGEKIIIRSVMYHHFDL
jgi:hypothetical protein